MPCHWLVPERVAMSTCAPGCLPNSALYESRCTLNSRTASTPSSMPLVPPGCMLLWAAPVNFTPLSRDRFWCGRLAETAILLAVVEGEMPVPRAFCVEKFATHG